MVARKLSEKEEREEVVPGSGMFKEEGKRIYRIEFNDGTIKLVKVPEDWKITFSAFNPGSKGGYGNENGGPTLRMYETETKQRAVFRQVKSFMDMCIEVVQQVTDKESSSSVKHDEKGYKIASDQAFEITWTKVDSF